MFSVLLESRARRARQRGGAMVSVLVHTVLGLFALAATRSDGPGSRSAPPPERTILVYAPRAQPTTQPSSPRRSSPNRIGDHRPPLVPLIFDPVGSIDIPPIGEVPSASTAEGWDTRTSIGGSDFRRSTGGGGTVDGIPFESGVDKPAIALAGNPAPRYPDVLRRAGIEGGVTIQVVVDTTGHADMTTLRVVSSDHALFEATVLVVLPRYRFVPAVSADRKVKMWVIVPFVFEVRQ